MFLTPKQYATLVWVRAYWASHGYGPSLHEAAHEFGVSYVTIYERMQALVTKGAMKNSKGRARAYEPTAKDLSYCPTCGHSAPLEASK